jgi:hypothetical protein
MEEAATPFPREETTPPVTKIYFGAILDWPRLAVLLNAPGLSDLRRSDVHIIMVAKRGSVNETREIGRIKNFIARIGDVGLRRRRLRRKTTCEFARAADSNFSRRGGFRRVGKVRVAFC